MSYQSLDTDAIRTQILGSSTKNWPRASLLNFQQQRLEGYPCFVELLTWQSDFPEGWVSNITGEPPIRSYGKSEWRLLAQKPGKRKHRLQILCPFCNKWVFCGRFHQHGCH